MKQNLRCARCGCVTLKPAVVIGAQPFGRVCAIKAGLLRVKRRAARVIETARQAVRDAQTMDLFAESAC